MSEIREKINELKATSKLHSRVINEILEDSKGYDGDFKQRLMDRLEDIGHGLSSGVVGSLIYYTDTCRFFKRYEDEINDLLTETISETGMQPAELFGDKWDSEDPLAREYINQNLLAWFGFEETTRRLFDN